MTSELTSPGTSRATVDQVDVRGPRFVAWVTTVVLVVTLLVSAVSLVTAAGILGVQAAVFAIGAAGGPGSTPTAGLRHAGRAAARTGHREGTGAAAEVRATGRARLRRRRRRRIRNGGWHARLDRHRVGPDRRIPQRRLRHLPGLSALPPGRASASIEGHRVIPRLPSNRKDLRHRLAPTSWSPPTGPKKRSSMHPTPSSSRSTKTPSPSRQPCPQVPSGCDWKTELQDQVKRDFVDQQQFSKLLSDKGIGNDDTVILYGGNNNWFAAYAYWYFKLYGHENVKLLDGGRKKWELDGRPLSPTCPTGRRPPTAPRRPTPASARSATRSSRRSTRRTSSTCARPTSSPARSSRPHTCRRNRASAPGISPAPSMFRGARRPTKTARSSRTTTWPRCTPRPD